MGDHILCDQPWPLGLTLGAANMASGINSIPVEVLKK